MLILLDVSVGNAAVDSLTVASVPVSGIITDVVSSTAEVVTFCKTNCSGDQCQRKAGSDSLHLFVNLRRI